MQATVTTDLGEKKKKKDKTETAEQVIENSDQTVTALQYGRENPTSSPVTYPPRPNGRSTAVNGTATPGASTRPLPLPEGKGGPRTHNLP